MALILFDAPSEMWATHVFNIANGKLPSRSVGVHFSFLYEKKKKKNATWRQKGSTQKQLRSISGMQSVYSFSFDLQAWI